jgi:predicted nicotinamide N-methyase
MDRQAFIEANTTIKAVPGLPDITLYQATEVTPLWQATEDNLQQIGIAPPFWAFPWAGGQALALHVRDNPELVRGRHVLDMACGSGLVGIAALKAGAATVLAADIDPMAAAAAIANAALNGLVVETTTDDLLDGPPPAGIEVVLAGDMYYERGLAARAIAWLKAVAAAGLTVLAADPGRKYFDDRGMELLALHDIPTTLEIEEREIANVGVWQV